MANRCDNCSIETMVPVVRDSCKCNMQHSFYYMHGQFKTHTEKHPVSYIVI